MPKNSNKTNKNLSSTAYKTNKKLSSTKFSGAVFFKKSQTFLGANLAKTRALAVPEEKFTKRFVIFSWVLLFFLSLALTGVFTKLPKEVPLFYSKAWGREQLVGPYFLFLPLLLSVAFIFLNSYLAGSRLGEFGFLKRVLLLGACVSCFLSIITVIRVLFLLI